LELIFYTRNKSIFFQNWFDQYILLVSQLINSQGLLFSHKEFLDHFQFPFSLKEFFFNSCGFNPIRCSCFIERNSFFSSSPSEFGQYSCWQIVLCFSQ